jgi:hypothetical protein
MARRPPKAMKFEHLRKKPQAEAWGQNGAIDRGL